MINFISILADLEKLKVACILILTTGKELSTLKQTNWLPIKTQVLPGNN